MSQTKRIKGAFKNLRVSDILDRIAFDTTWLENNAEKLREELFLLAKKIEDISLRNARSMDNTIFFCADIEKEYAKRAKS